MITIYYDPKKYPATPDGFVMSTARKIAKSGNDTVLRTSSALLIDAFRLLIAKGKLSQDDLIIIVGDSEYRAKRAGDIDCVVAGKSQYPSINVRILFDIAMAAVGDK